MFSVLDLDAFERANKAEGLGVSDTGAHWKNLQDNDEICKLFRFLQLLCEGHNLGTTKKNIRTIIFYFRKIILNILPPDFQNYLRSQAGNTSTVNIIICTVDYLLRLQESIMDFYWNYSGRDSIDFNGKSAFFRAITVAAQLFASITEFIQVHTRLNMSCING